MSWVANNEMAFTFKVLGHKQKTQFETDLVLTLESPFENIIYINDNTL